MLSIWSKSVPSLVNCNSPIANVETLFEPLLMTLVDGQHIRQSSV